MKKIEKYSFGTGDRFTMQGKAQLSAIIEANKLGFPVVPVWNKSNREHQIVKTRPADTWKEAVEATRALGYNGSWYVDADHINLKNVGEYIGHSNFFTLDVADAIGTKAGPEESAFMLEKLRAYKGKLKIPGIDEAFLVTDERILGIVDNFFNAINEASLIYSRIKEQHASGDFITEVSMDEVEQAQTPVELFFILLMISHFGIPVQTIAPKFTGRFNKGVDYVGDLDLFKQEFEQDLLVIDYAVKLSDCRKISNSASTQEVTSSQSTR
jgi:tagaturonate epimerase